jgi:N-acetylneuraminate synthase
LWFASAWDVESQYFLRRYDCKYNKVASAMLTHKPLLEAIAEEGKHTFISTGMSDYAQIDAAIDVFNAKKCSYTLMHCVSTYPCPDEDCNIGVIRTLKKRYNCPIGYSGHEFGVLPSVLAASCGAEVIERHITLDRAMYGSDQAASLEEPGLRLMVRDCRRVKSVLGDGQKRVLESEKKAENSLRYFRES